MREYTQLIQYYIHLTLVSSVMREYKSSRWGWRDKETCTMKDQGIGRRGGEMERDGGKRWGVGGGGEGGVTERHGEGGVGGGGA